jgi:hypothetical protein
MKQGQKTRSSLAVKAALDIIGPCHRDTAAYLLLAAVAEHLSACVGNEKASELTYGVADRIATGGAR